MYWSDFHAFHRLIVETVNPSIFICDDGKLVLLVVSCEVWVWELDKDQVWFAARSPQLFGCWSLVRSSDTVILPQPHYLETAVDAIFYISDVSAINENTSSFILNRLTLYLWIC